jgi:hypothetical protein
MAQLGGAMSIESATYFPSLVGVNFTSNTATTFANDVYSPPEYLSLQTSSFSLLSGGIIPTITVNLLDFRHLLYTLAPSPQFIVRN